GGVGGSEGGEGKGGGGGGGRGEGTRQGEGGEGRRGSGGPPQGSRREAPRSDRRSREVHCRKTIGGDGECAQHRQRDCGRHCRAADGHGARERRGQPSGQQSDRALRKPMFEAEFWVAVAFVIFVGVLGYVQAHKRLIGSIDDRRERIKSELEEARRLKVEAEALLATYRRKQQEAESEAQTIIASAKAEAERLAAEAEAKIEEFV